MASPKKLCICTEVLGLFSHIIKKKISCTLTKCFVWALDPHFATYLSNILELGSEPITIQKQDYDSNKKCT